MVVFINRFFYYLLLLLFLLLLLEFQIFPNNSNEMGLKNKLLIDRGIDTDVLILGNSHTFFGINPDWMSFNAINCANKSRKLETDYYLLKRNINFLTNLKSVIIPISHYTLFTGDVSENEKRLYYNFYDLPEYDQGIINNSLIIHQSFKELTDDWIFQNTKLSIKGWRANGNSYIYNEAITKEKVGEMDIRFNRKTVINNNLNYLSKCIQICIDNEVQLYLLIPPYHPDFYRFSSGKYTNEINKLLNKIDIKSSIIIDSRNFNIKEDLYFENIDNLNKEGAKIMSDNLDRILKLKIHE